MAPRSAPSGARLPTGKHQSFSWNPLSLNPELRDGDCMDFAQEGHDVGVSVARGNEGFGSRAAVVMGKGSLQLGHPEHFCGMNSSGNFCDVVRYGSQSSGGGSLQANSNAGVVFGSKSSNYANPRIGASLMPKSPFPICPSSFVPEVCLEKVASDREEFLSDHALICRFTKIWPKLCDLHAWVTENWQEFMGGEISIYPCAKGFFILEFDSQKDKELVLECGPWIFQGDFLCMKPWFPEFDPRTKIFNTTFCG